MNANDFRRRWRRSREIRATPEPVLNDRLAAVIAILDGLDAPSYHWVLNEAAYARPWRPERKGWANVLDQVLHFACGALLVLPCVATGALWGRALAGFTAGALREVDQYLNQDLRIKMIKDRLVDITFFTLGSFFLAWLLD